MLKKIWNSGILNTLLVIAWTILIVYSTSVSYVFLIVAVLIPISLLFLFHIKPIIAAKIENPWVKNEDLKDKEGIVIFITVLFMLMMSLLLSMLFILIWLVKLAFF